MENVPSPLAAWLLAIRFLLAGDAADLALRREAEVLAFREQLEAGRVA